MRGNLRYLIVITCVFLLAAPIMQGTSSNSFWNSSGFDLPEGSGSLAEGASMTAGTGSPIPYSMTGIAINSYDGTFIIDSANSEIGTISLSDGWTGSNLQATIDELSIQIDDALRNPNWDEYHNEKWLIGLVASRVEDVVVPNEWTLIFNDSDDSPH
ncbi:MAG: hypothetical protein ACFFAY_13365, partial [Promethearchaeota archaeon]